MTNNNWNESLIISKKIKRNKAQRILALYNACKQNDISNVSKCLSLMKIDEINYQNPIDGNTILHEVVKFGFIDIIKLLLKYNAICSIRNHDRKTPFNLAETTHIRQAFKPEHTYSRFSSNPNSSLQLKLVDKNKIQCKSASMINEQSSYEWELVDNLAYQNALRLRHELKPYQLKNFLQKSIFSIDKGYFKIYLIDLESIESIRHSFKLASEENNPFHILTAYTKHQNFTYQINMDMARNVIHDLRNGCSLFSCNCLYSTQDGTRSITSILLYHSHFQSLNFIGQVYRGLYIKKSLFPKFKEQSRIITTTFLSTSKTREVAEIFSASNHPTENLDYISVLCIYKIKNQNRTAIDITEYSQIPDEEEVLILPYSSFDIIHIKKDEETNQTEIYLEECDPT